MRYKTISLFLSIFVISISTGDTFAGVLSRDEAIDIFFQANNEYGAAQKALAAKNENDALEKFQHATQLYNNLIQSEYENGQIYYNLGNSYYRQGMPGKSIVSYRKAEKILPRNADIKTNIVLLKNDFEDKESKSQLPEFLKTFCFWYFFLNLNEITTLTIYVYLAFMATIVSFIFLPHRWLKNTCTAFAICLFVFVVSLGIKSYYEYSYEKGVVITEKCKIRYGPGEEFEPKF
ncbi:MAG: tetratricopeptide repeat protein, partial [Planctomycetes bacterium]|nr:tetratricopeptide repeat protein [Planctomycetota bacterium]